MIFPDLSLGSDHFLQQGFVHTVQFWRANQQGSSSKKYKVYVIFGFDLTLVRKIIDNKSLDGQALNKSSLKAARQWYGHQSSENQLAACDNLLFRAR